MGGQTQHHLVYKGHRIRPTWKWTCDVCQKPNPETGRLPFRGTVHTVRKLMGRSGVLSLWNGFFPYYLRCGGHTVSMFVAVEQLRKFL